MRTKKPKLPVEKPPVGDPYRCMNCDESQELLGEATHQSAALLELLLDKRAYHLVQEFISALRSKVHQGKCKQCEKQARGKYPLWTSLATAEELARATITENERD